MNSYNKFFKEVDKEHIFLYDAKGLSVPRYKIRKCYIVPGYIFCLYWGSSIILGLASS
jgi:hypothetical protein